MHFGRNDGFLSAPSSFLSSLASSLAPLRTQRKNGLGFSHAITILSAHSIKWHTRQFFFSLSRMDTRRKLCVGVEKIQWQFFLLLWSHAVVSFVPHNNVLTGKRIGSFVMGGSSIEEKYMLTSQYACYVCVWTTFSFSPSSCWFPCPPPHVFIHLWECESTRGNVYFPSLRYSCFFFAILTSYLTILIQQSFWHGWIHRFYT